MLQIYFSILINKKHLKFLIGDSGAPSGRNDNEDQKELHLGWQQPPE
jgi:hypothetical protein